MGKLTNDIFNESCCDGGTGSTNKESSQPYLVNRELLAWAAGIFEGEGTFSTRRTGKHDRGLVAKVKMADKDVVQRLHTVVGVGHFTGPYKCDGAGKKDLWVWQTGAFESVQHVMSILWPWLHSRRRAKIKELLAGYHSEPPIMIAIARDPKTGRLLSGRFKKYASRFE